MLPRKTALQDNLSIWSWTEEHPENLALKASSAWVQELHWAGGNILEDVYKVSCMLAPSTKWELHGNLD